MNASTFPLPLRAFSARNTRAQFSPVLRPARLGSVARRDVTERFSRGSSSTAVLVDDTLADLNRATSQRWWDPNLVDRLRSPLTRFHD